MIEGFTGLGDSKSTGRGSFFHEDEARLKADVVASTPLPITIDPTDKVMEGFVRFSNYMTENIRASESPTITDLINADGNLRSIVPNGFILIANKLDALIQDEAERRGGGLGGLRLGGGGGGGGATALEEMVASAVGSAFGTSVGAIGTAVGGAISTAVGGLNLGAIGTALGVAIVPLLVGAVAEFADNARYQLGEMALSVYEQGYELNERLISYASKAFAVDKYDTNGDGRVSPYEGRKEFLEDKEGMSDMLSFNKGNAWNQRMLSMYVSEGGTNFTLLPTVEEQYEAYKGYLDWRDDNGWNGSDAQRFESFMRDNYRESTARLYSTKMNAESLFDAEFDANDLRLSNGYKGYYSELSDEKIEQLIEMLEKSVKAIEDNTESVVGNTEATEVEAIVTTTTSGGRYSELKAQREAEKGQTESKGVQSIMSQRALDSIYKMNPLVPTGAYGSNMSMMAPELMTQADYAPTGTVFSMPSLLAI